jgi:F0F1-type ATP synthase assembly protein I
LELKHPQLKRIGRLLRVEFQKQTNKQTNKQNPHMSGEAEACKIHRELLTGVMEVGNYF